MKLSYAITVCNELLELKALLTVLRIHKREEDEIVVLFDKKNGTPEVWSYLSEDETIDRLEAATFKNHFADWKNKLTSFCTGDFIFQIDADERPNPLLINNLPTIIESNPHNEVYLVPRINIVEGLTDEHIQKWRWNVNEKGWVNFPDYQWRVWKNDAGIEWKNKVHEVLSGHKTFAPLPHEESFCLYHPKDIKRQERQNDYYSTLS